MIAQTLKICRMAFRFRAAEGMNLAQLKGTR
jgi:hypothetical protein